MFAPRESEDLAFGELCMKVTSVDHSPKPNAYHLVEDLIENDIKLGDIAPNPERIPQQTSDHTSPYGRHQVVYLV